MAAINVSQTSVSRSASAFISAHLPALPFLASRLSAPSSASSSSLHATEDSVKETYETPTRTLGSLLAELFPPFLLAVPKSKTSHSRKSMRSATKGLKNKTNINLCPACGSPKLMHHLCPRCYSQISRRWKAETRSSLTTQQAPITQNQAESDRQPAV
ncbi:hypothetical protein NliqN6_4323 [Naganishia liquefaciens]|uniref:Large ribosomal subunit protein bL32m n=1 Tax=Naganishia liquefaciens TaxID=104408 RepID=A0A8H3TVX4_9TREE|nr:hypothetical protein NliqN6_4323 [Naganishia liquefaciens]